MIGYETDKIMALMKTVRTADTIIEDEKNAMIEFAKTLPIIICGTEFSEERKKYSRYTTLTLKIAY